VEGLGDELSLFILGRFDLTHGSLVAQKPGDFGIKEVWGVEGDELGTGLFFAEKKRARRAVDQQKLEEAVSALSSRWSLRRYPWAGALSTAHTLLWYARHGKDVFRRMGQVLAGKVPGARARTATARFDVARLAAASAEHEAALWDRMVRAERSVSRAVYEERAAAIEHAEPATRAWRFVAGAGPVVLAKPRPGGRRPSHAHNATKA
jgi:hypothetical protein